ncbi:hypothetical protein NDN08_007632 [Rhodosorus marinus]|uniref:CP12 domain-containing protein n=1 Tax=Rhodosorus marinus TaxID=101924 RepID=A0AAV8UY38_9RHOD|nr:hypothetical protein NDN08_007632 [Rhodosorus marinus]
MVGFVNTIATPVQGAKRASCASASRRMVVVYNKEMIRDKIAAAVKEASEKSDKFGKQSQEAAVAWDVVEELSAELSHEKANDPKADPLDVYCEESPEADECRTYED